MRADAERFIGDYGYCTPAGGHYHCYVIHGDVVQPIPQRGELIGRDPRKVSADDWERAGIEGQPILRVIRAKCLDCRGEQESEVRKCVAVACPNWPYRMGENPFRAAREMTDEERVALGERLARSRAARENSPLKSKLSPGKAGGFRM
jgi:hypothetical protein